MSIIKSFAVGHGDMFCIDHGSDNFTIIDCVLPSDRQKEIIGEINTRRASKGITRFISTHPDQDHISGLVALDDAISIVNFYCVKNKAVKEDPTTDFNRYCELRDSAKAFHIFRDCSRRWMNESSEERGSSGLNVLWPDVSNASYKEALARAEASESPNNLSIILRYALTGGPSAMWMGDLETTFMTEVQDAIKLPQTDILFAPHHGRDSGRVPEKWLKEIAPKIIVIGQAPSEHLNYYVGYNTITQNSAGDITFDVRSDQVRIYVSSSSYEVGFLEDENLPNTSDGYYLGTLILDPSS